MVSTLLSAKEQVMPLIVEDLQRYDKVSLLDSRSPDEDPGKFLLNGKVARVIYRRDGFYAKINQNWFDGSFQPPEISGGEFYWYVFALAPGNRDTALSYFVCTYQEMIEFVLDFQASKGNDYRDQSTWNGRFLFVDEEKNVGYFAWRDEDPDERKPDRFVRLRNIETIFSDVNFISSNSDVLTDLLAQKDTYNNLPPTEREAIVKSRIGQGQFRKDLVEFWKKCSVTGVTNLDFLVASHIKPWRVSSNFERLHKYNGLLLTPNLDALFDRGYISFTKNGSIVLSNQIGQDALQKLGIHLTMHLDKIENEHLGYLEHHREHIFKK